MPGSTDSPGSADQPGAGERPVGGSPREPIFFESVAELRSWLEEHHATASELFVGAWRKGTGRPSTTWEEMVDEALCVGWIDGIKRSLPDGAWSQRLTPRRAGSNWSMRNVGRVEELRREGRMRPAGEAAFAARREDRTGIYSFEQAETPSFTDQEAARFQADPAAWAWFSSRAPSYRRAAVHWVVSAKRPETRERRLAVLIEDSAANRTIRPLTPTRKLEGKV